MYFVKKKQEKRANLKNRKKIIFVIFIFKMFRHFVQSTFFKRSLNLELHSRDEVNNKITLDFSYTSRRNFNEQGGLKQKLH